MNTDIVSVLSSIQSRIFRGFCVVIIGLGATIIMFLGAVYYGGGITPALLQRNYSSVQYAAEMKKAIYALAADSVVGSQRNAQALESFSKQLDLEFQNITEPGEREIVDSIKSDWERYLDSQNVMTPEISVVINSRLDDLIDVNEKAMFNLAQQANNLRLSVVVSGVGVGFLAIMYSLLFAGSTSRSLSEKVQEVLLGAPNLKAPIRDRETILNNAVEVERLTKEIVYLLR